MEAVLAELAEADLALARAPDIGVDGPCRLGEVTLDFLQKTVASSFSGATILSFESCLAHDGMTDRQKWKLDWDVGTYAGNGLPQHIFAKATPHPLAHREMLAMLHMDKNEVNFLTRIQPAFADITPRALFARAYGGGRSLIILEDLTDRGCTPVSQGDAVSVAYARAGAVTLATLHARFWDKPDLAQDQPWLRPRPAKAGWPWQRAEQDRTRTIFMETAPKAELPDDARPVLEYWHANYAAAYRQWECLPGTMLHGDPHLGNTYALPDGRTGFLDWQCMFAGNGFRDLSYFLMSTLTDDDRKRHEREIFDLYVETLRQLGVALDGYDWWDAYCLFIFDFWDAVIMTCVHGTYNHARHAHERQLTAMAGAVRDNDVGGRLEALVRRSR